MVFEFSFNAIAIAGLVGTLLALFFAYFPSVRVWWASLEQDKKSLFNLGFLVLAEAVIGLLSYYQVIKTVPPFSWQEAIAVFAALVVSNQPVAQLLPITKDVKAALQAKMLKLLQAPK
jgi:hypothetical protein